MGAGYLQSRRTIPVQCAAALLAPARRVNSSNPAASRSRRLRTRRGIGMCHDQGLPAHDGAERDDGLVLGGWWRRDS
jgi:hypothetical protein